MAVLLISVWPKIEEIVDNEVLFCNNVVARECLNVYTPIYFLSEISIPASFRYFLKETDILSLLPKGLPLSVKKYI